MRPTRPDANLSRFGAECKRCRALPTNFRYVGRNVFVLGIAQRRRVQAGLAGHYELQSPKPGTVAIDEVVPSGFIRKRAEARRYTSFDANFIDFDVRRKAGSSATPRWAADRGNAAVTLEMVAQDSGVSPSTVSRILNGTAVVSELKKKAVGDSIAKLGFVPNPVARGLAGGRTLSVGVVTQAIDSPFYGAALRGIEDELDPAGYRSLFVSGHWDAATEARCIEVLRSRRVDGIIVLTGRLSDQALKTCAKSLPVVVTGRSLKAAGLFALSFDNFEGGRLATQHLIELGHRRIAFISGDPNHPDATERLRGYRAALEAAGIAYDARLVVPGAFHEESGLLGVEQLLSSGQRFTAIFAANDQMALGAALGLHRRSLRVPEDVSLVGFDDLPSSLYATPPLSTMHQPAYEMGRLAAAAMLQLLAGIKPAAEVPAPRLIARESSRRPSV